MGKLVGENHSQRTDDHACCRNAQEPPHPKKVEHRTADCDGDGKAEELDAKDQADHCRRVGLIDRIEKLMLEYGGKVRADARGDACCGKGDDAHDK